LVQVFKQAFVDYEYRGRYRGVYPVKVNQQRHLVEDLLSFGRQHHFGLECGSKPELLVALAMMDDPEALIICNGYKDRRYVKSALLAAKLGRDPILVIEKLSEIDTIVAEAEKLGVRPKLGVRAKLSNRGKGRWHASSGDRAKFGLFARGIMELVSRLRREGYLDCLRLLHFHIGSQVTSIRTFKHALREASRLYVELARVGAPMGLFDVGGGLGVDYDGSKTTFESSVNYSEAEYASDVVYAIGSACDEAEVQHPDIVTESGRATVAHCSVLLFDILGVERLPTEGAPLAIHEDDHSDLHDLLDVYKNINAKTYQEAWHDANDLRERALHEFEFGTLNLETLARLEHLYYQTCGRIRHVARSQNYVPDDLDALEPALADTYYGNFSVFQSVPDAWAVGQLFPLLPVHRLDEKPTRRAVIADLTCDSDGKLDRFINRRDVKRVLELHQLRPGKKYVLALTLVGAYQEILGDMHNLFGDTNAVHVSMVDDNEYSIDLVLEGDRVEAVVEYVQYERRDLVHRV
ncbi:MAG: biosynthetic arginine decarboxylase, partial [Proteobacteria bacterium]|nr:biosynthetic arginine decarboxylase [Pseudomonadota bacterium]